MKQLTRLAAFVAAASLAVGCTVYPRSGNVSAMADIRQDLDGRDGLAGLREGVAANEAALLKIAAESRDDAASAGPTKPDEQLDSRVLGVEAALFLLRLPKHRASNEAVAQLGASVSTFAGQLAEDALSACRGPAAPEGARRDSCWRADLFADAVETAPLSDALRDMPNDNLANYSGQDWARMTNAMRELGVLLDEEWVSAVADGPSAGASERLAYLAPYLCYADQTLIEVRTQADAMKTDAQEQWMTDFLSAGREAVATGAGLSGFSARPETLAGCASNSSGETECRTRANWGAVSTKCMAVRTCMSAGGGQADCINQQMSATPAS